MGKKKQRAPYTSKGQGRNVAREHRVKRDLTDPVERFHSNARKLYAHLDGKNAYVTIPNNGGNASREPYIRVPAKEVFPNRGSFKMPERP